MKEKIKIAVLDYSKSEACFYILNPIYFDQLLNEMGGGDVDDDDVVSYYLATKLNYNLSEINYMFSESIEIKFN
jgi:hypothetical protein